VTQPGVSMGSTGDPRGESSLAPYGPVTSSRKHGAARKAGPAIHDICPARSVICRVQYRSLVRLAVLLTGDAGAAEAVVLDSFAALHCPRNRPQTKDDALPHLRRLLVARSHLASHHHLWDGSRRPRCGGRGRLLHQHTGPGTPPGQGQVSVTDRPAFNP